MAFFMFGIPLGIVPADFSILDVFHKLRRVLYLALIFTCGIFNCIHDKLDKWRNILINRCSFKRG